MHITGIHIAAEGIVKTRKRLINAACVCLSDSRVSRFVCSKNLLTSLHPHHPLIELRLGSSTGLCDGHDTVINLYGTVRPLILSPMHGGAHEHITILYGRCLCELPYIILFIIIHWYIPERFNNIYIITPECALGVHGISKTDDVDVRVRASKTS